MPAEYPARRSHSPSRGWRGAEVRASVREHAGKNNFVPKKRTTVGKAAAHPFQTATQPLARAKVDSFDRGQPLFSVFESGLKIRRLASGARRFALPRPGSQYSRHRPEKNS